MKLSIYPARLKYALITTKFYGVGALHTSMYRYKLRALQYNNTYCCVNEILMSYGKSVIQVKTRNLLNNPCVIQCVSLFFFFFFFLLKEFGFQYIIR